MNGTHDIMHDSSELWTEEELKNHLKLEVIGKDGKKVRSNPFPFKGEGWYSQCDRTILIAGTNGRKGGVPLYRVTIWGKVPAEVLKVLQVLTTSLEKQPAGNVVPAFLTV